MIFSEKKKFFIFTSSRSNIKTVIKKAFGCTMAVVLSLSLALPSGVAFGIGNDVKSSLSVAASADQRIIMDDDSLDESPTTNFSQNNEQESSENFIPLDQISNESSSSNTEIDNNTPEKGNSNSDVLDSSTGEVQDVEQSTDKISDAESDKSDTELQIDDNSSVANSTDRSKESSSLNVMANGSVDLNKLWKEQQGGTAYPLTITEGGKYVLTNDLRVSSRLEINAPDKDVVIDLGEFCLSGIQTAGEYFISAKNCSSLTIMGKRPLAGISPEGAVAPLEQIVIDEGEFRHAIESSCKQLTLQNVGIALKGHKDYRQFTKLDAYGVYITKGKASLQNCSLFVDHSLQTTQYGVGATLKGFPAAVYVGPDTESLDLDRCDLKVLGSPAAGRSNNTEYKKDSYDNAYGIYGMGKTPINISGGSISVNAPQGSAIAALSSNLKVESAPVSTEIVESYSKEEDRDVILKSAHLSMKVDGKERAFGLMTTEKEGVMLNTPLEADFGSESYPQWSGMLRTTAEQGIIFGSDFTGQNISVLAGEDLSNLNLNGSHFGNFKANTTEVQKERITSSLSNGLENGSCSVVFDDAGLFFTLDDATAPVFIRHKDGSEGKGYVSVEEAAKDQKEGETITLRKNAPFITLDTKGASEDNADNGWPLLVDLNGCSVAGMSINTFQPVKITSSVGNRQGKLFGWSTDKKCCLAYSGTGGLSLENISIMGISQIQDGSAALITGSGSVLFSNTDVQMVSQYSNSRGIYQLSGDASISVCNSNVSAYTNSPSVNVYGVISNSIKGSIDIENSSIEGCSFNGVTGAVLCQGALTVKGNPGSTILSAISSQAASSIFAIQLANDNATADISNATLRALCESTPKTNSCWCLMVGSSRPLYTAQWALGGSCKFESATDTHINYKTAPINLKGNFSSSNPLYVFGQDLENSQAFSYEAGTDSSSLTKFSSLFKAVPNSLYDGWQLEAQDRFLNWAHEPVVRNERTGATYVSVREAAAEIDAGDTLTLLRNSKESQAIEFQVPATLNLDGKQLEFQIEVTSSSAIPQAVLALKGQGFSVIKNGTLAINKSFEGSFMSTNVNSAVLSAAENANVSLRGVHLAYNVKSIQEGTGCTSVQAIYAPSSSIALEDNTFIDVEVQGTQAVQAQGIFFGSTSNNSKLTIDESSKVIVQNSALRKSCGAIAYSSNTVSYKEANLMRFYPEKGTSLYQELQDKFKEVALADTALDQDGKVFETNMYYAAPMEMNDGTFVWAFSDPMEESEIGKLDNIKASVFYSQSHYDEMPQSEVLVVEGNTPNVNVMGALEAYAVNGEATGLLVNLGQKDQDKGKEKIYIGSSAKVQVNGSTEAYLKRSGLLDLRDVFDVELEKPLLYPQSYDPLKYQEIQYVYPTSDALAGNQKDIIQVEEGANINSSQSTSSNSEVLTSGLQAEEDTKIAGGKSATSTSLPKQTEPINVAADKVTVNFENIRAADGVILDSVAIELPYGSNISSTTSLPEPQDYQRNNITYRFVGWTAMKSGQSSRIWTQDNIENFILDETTDAFDGNQSFVATYVPITSGQYLASFYIDGFVEAYGVNTGESPDYRYAVKGSSTSIPKKYIRGDTDYWTVYGFTGWQDASSQHVFPSTLPRATGDCVYIASFSSSPSKLTARYYTWQPQGENLAYSYTRTQVYYGQNGAKEVAEIAKPGDIDYDETNVYSFLGWSPRKTDKEPYYGQIPPVVLDSDQSIYGIYSVRSRQIPVEFYVDGKLYAQASSVPGNSTINRAFSATGIERPKDISDTMRFRGWSLTSDNAGLLMGSVKTIASLTEAENPVRLYAVYGAPSAQEEESPNSKNEIEAGQKNPLLQNSKRTKAPSLKSISALNSFGSLGTVPLAAAVPGSMANPAGEFVGSSSASADSAMTLEGAEGEGDQGFNKALVMLITLGVFLAVCFLGWLFSILRNRKLDREDNFFEVDAGLSQGERIVF